MTDLVQISNGLADAVASAGARVVRVEGRRRTPASGLLWSDGTVVTASHVVSTRRPSRIGWPDGSVSEASVVGRDQTTDVAVLATDGKAGMRAPDGASVRVGELALAVARPGSSLRSSLGAVTASEGPWRTPYGTEVAAYLEAGLTMYPGFSGGALASASGSVVGMLTSALLPGHAVAIPVATLASLVADLSAHGRVRRGYLGVGVQSARIGPEGDAGQSRGLLVAAVEPESPAERSGVLVGDVLLSLDGKRLEAPDDLLAALSADRLERELALQLLRGGAPLTVGVTLSERAEPGEGS
jgi:S1-C subfamily serine protease